MKGPVRNSPMFITFADAIMRGTASSNIRFGIFLQKDAHSRQDEIQKSN